MSYDYFSFSFFYNFRYNTFIELLKKISDVNDISRSLEKERKDKNHKDKNVISIIRYFNDVYQL